MKKSLVAVGVIVALGAVWAGSAWYTGKQLEPRLDELLAQANAQLDRAAPQAGLVLSYQNYQRGVFSSDLQLIASPKPGVANGWLKPGDSVTFKEKIDHGPFPLMSLAKFNLLPAMGAVSTTLENTPTSARLFAAANGKAPFELQTRVGYSGSTRYDATINPLSMDSAKGKFALGAGDFTVKADSDQNDMAITGQLDSGLFSTINDYDQQVQFTTGKLTLDGNTSLSSFAERIGKQSLTLDKLAIAVEGKELAIVEGVKIDANTDADKDGKSLNGQIDYSLDALKMQNRNLGSGKLHVAISKLDGTAMHQFSQALEQQQQAIQKDPALANDPQKQQQKAIQAITDNLPLLLKGNPVVNVSPLSWKNDKGEATANLTLALKDPAGQPVTAATAENQLDRLVRSLDLKLNIPLDVANAFMTEIAQLEGYQESDAAKLAEQQVKGVSAMGQMFQITTEKDNAIQTSVKYANGQVNINGRTMSLDDFIGKYTLPTGVIPDANSPSLQ
ncbi:hypothetical protein TUM12370_21380 [Salmonella enterica subsp. enterica serovar Choleraesuis]|nr:hypothetical protein TUM12370_21380 [Salmonella enterica subsp. enterica serovar Choleraesuis]